MNKYHQIARRIFWAIVLGVSFYPAHTNATFEDRSTQLGLALTNGPAAWGDYDNDGWVDLYAAGALWRNNEGKNFTKVMGKGFILLPILDWKRREQSGKVKGDTELFSDTCLKEKDCETVTKRQICA